MATTIEIEELLWSAVNSKVIASGTQETTDTIELTAPVLAAAIHIRGVFAASIPISGDYIQPYLLYSVDDSEFNSEEPLHVYALPRMDFFAIGIDDGSAPSGHTVDISAMIPRLPRYFRIICDSNVTAESVTLSGDVQTSENVG